MHKYTRGSSKLDIKYVKDVPVSDIFNGCSPEYMLEVRRVFQKTFTVEWFADKYDEVRKDAKHLYIKYFNEENGHFDKLEKSTAENGIRNPILLTEGDYFHIKPMWVPTHDKPFTCELQGGSRLLTAQKLGIETVPAIIQSKGSVSLEGRTLHTTNDVTSVFIDKPDSIQVTQNGVRIVPHLKFIDKDYNLPKQMVVRKRVIENTIKELRHKYDNLT